MWTTILALGLVLAACGDDEDDDTGGTTDGGATDGGATDGGATDGGATDGGSGDGGSDGGGTDGGSGDGGAEISSLLTETGGCADTFLWATNPEQTWALTFRDDSHLAQQAHAEGTTVTRSYDMALDYGLAPSLSVQLGSNLQRQFCTDVVEPYEITTEWFISAGLVTISVTPTGDPTDWGEYPADATLTVEDGVFSATGETTIEVRDLTFTAAVGWLPG